MPCWGPITSSTGMDHPACNKSWINFVPLTNKINFTKSNKIMDLINSFTSTKSLCFYEHLIDFVIKIWSRQCWTYPESTAIAFLVESVDWLQDFKKFKHALKIAEDSVFLEVLLDKFPQGFWFVGVYHIFWKELVQSDFFFKILEIGLFVKSDLWHILEEPSYLDTTELNRRVQIQRFKVLLEVIIPNLKNLNYSFM